MAKRGLRIDGKKARPGRQSLVVLLLLSLPVLALMLFRGQITPLEDLPEAGILLQEIREEEDLQPGMRAIAKVGEAPIYEGTAMQARRLSTALYGEGLEVLTREGEMVQGRLDDGFTGWFRLQDLSADVASATGEQVQKQALVLATAKRVMSHSIKGQLRFEAPMGSLLPVDYVHSEVLRISLPLGEEGWVTRDSVRLLEPGEAIGQGAQAASLFLSSAMNFYGARYVPGGMSRQGADMAGIIYVSAKVNGLRLPRSLEAQAQMGQEAELIYDAKTGLPRSQVMQAGDVLFFAASAGEKKPAFAAVILEGGRALVRLTNDSSIILRSLDQDPQLMARLITARRYFP